MNDFKKNLNYQGQLNGVRKEFYITAFDQRYFDQQRLFDRKEWTSLCNNLQNLLDNLKATKKNVEIASDPELLNCTLHYILAAEGHNITIFYADSNKAPNFGENISTIQVDLEPNQERSEIFAKMTWNNVAHGYLFAFMFLPAVADFQQLLIYKSDKLLEVLNGNFDLILVDPVITIHGIQISQIASKALNSKIPDEIQSFIDNPKSKGTIYIAFGTFAKWDFAPQKIIDAYLQAFEELKKYRIIFAYNGKKKLKVGKHVKLVSWAPQMAILNHSKTKVFVTHGGLKSLKEALCAEIPIVLMPLLAEQAHNAKFALKLGIGQIINKFSITKDQIIDSIREVANNSKYAKRIATLKEQILFRPIPSLKLGTHKIQKFLRIRTKFGFKRYDFFHEKVFTRKGIQLGSLVYYGFDILIIAFVFIVILFK
uniref:UDP-glucuronosyltransferase n=1 Tax=Panagrolaimus sp. ES5 TaxID=591445 RepID=A0AC34FY25_9BILA